MASAEEMSDPVSPYERPIRPLPKRRLRERLSPEVADSILYPPAPPMTAPLFYPSYAVRENVATSATVDLLGTVTSTQEGKAERRDYVSRRVGEGTEVDESFVTSQGRGHDRRTGDASIRSYRYVQKPGSKYPNPNGMVSAASSVDGYDSFENTNNKKKRKIPTPGENGVHLSNDFTNSSVGDEPLEDTHVGVVTYHAPANAGSQGLSGPGRGRYGRNRNGRSPLRTLSDTSANWGNGRTTKARPQWVTQNESPGIISRSIASANADKSPIRPAPGQENFSLLQQQASKKTSPSTQFTFTCDSQIPGTITWPGAPVNPAHHSPATRTSIHDSHGSPNASVHNNIPSAVERTSSHPGNNAQKPAPATGQTKKSRRRPSKDYLMAARQRRQQQEFRNFHHPPSSDEVWICEFCEYERIFGTPPEALIRQYEIKDRRVRKQEAERRRLLEKAKMKGRKGRKGSKMAPKPTASHDRQIQNHQGQRPTPVHHSHSQGTQSEEYYDDEYDEDYAQDDPPPPSPVGLLAHQHESPHSDAGDHGVARRSGLDHRGTT